LKKQDEKTAVAEPEEEEATNEQGPLSKLLKTQTETNSLLKAWLKKQDEEDEEKEEAENQKDEVAKEVVSEQTNQSAPKKISATGPQEAEAPAGVSKQETEEKEPDEKEAYPYPYPEEAKAIAKAFPYPYSHISSKREEIVAKQLFNSNQEIARLNGQLAKMVSPEKVEEMVNTRFQQKMMEEGFVSSTGATSPIGASPTEIAKEDETFEGGSDLQKATDVASKVRGLTWEHIIATRQETDPAYRLFLKQTPGVRMKGGM